MPSIPQIGFIEGFILCDAFEIVGERFDGRIIENVNERMRGQVTSIVRPTVSTSHDRYGTRGYGFDELLSDVILTIGILDGNHEFVGLIGIDIVEHSSIVTLTIVQARTVGIDFDLFHQLADETFAAIVRLDSNNGINECGIPPFTYVTVRNDPHGVGGFRLLFEGNQRRLQQITQVGVHVEIGGRFRVAVIEIVGHFEIVLGPAFAR